MRGLLPMRMALLAALLANAATPVLAQTKPGGDIVAPALSGVSPSAGTYTPSPAARALGQQTYQESDGDWITVHPNLLGGQTYRDPAGGLVVSKPTIMGGEVIRDQHGRVTSARPNVAGGQTFVDHEGRVTICRPTIGGQQFCQDQPGDPGLVNPRAIRDQIVPAR